MPEKLTYEEMENRNRKLEPSESRDKNTRYSLNKSINYYRTIFDSANDAIFIHDVNDGSILDVNKKMLEMYGYTEEETYRLDVGSLSEGVSPYSQFEAMKWIQKASKGKPQIFDWKAKKKNGDLFWLEVNLKLVILDDKEYIMSIARDITARKLSEEFLRQSEQRYRTILESIDDAYFEIDLTGKLIFFNNSMCRITGFSRDELAGLDYREYMDKDTAKRVYKTYLNVMETGKPVKRIEYQIRRDHMRKYVSSSVSLLLDSKNKPIGFRGILSDITKNKIHEKEKATLQEQLQRSQKLESIGNLAGGIAHDFNNILSSIIGFTELALDDVTKGTPLEDNLQEVNTAGKRARDLVKQILAFARQPDERQNPLQVGTIVEEVLKLIRSTIPTSIEIKRTIDSQSSIMGNPTQLHQVFMNLFTNAAQAMEAEGGVLEIGLKDVEVDRNSSEKLDLRRGNYIKISIADTGVGIPFHIIHSVFDPYFTTKAPGEGTGMGLAMVQGIVESYSGKITVDSQVGKGTTFTLYLPITRKRSGHAACKVDQLPTGTEAILLVDDEAPIAKMGSRSLESLGYSVTTRTSSIEALDLFQVKPNAFDLVVTDMTMPNMTGDRLAAELMKIRPDIPVILCTGYSKNISEETASEIGIKAFAYKPIVKADLAKTVRKVLDEAKG